MVQPPHIAVGDGSHHDANMFSAGLQLLGQFHPSLIAVHDAVDRLDDHGSQLWVAGLDHARVCLLVAAGTVPRRQATEASQLLAGLETIETPDLGPHRGSRHQADPFLLAELFDHSVASDPLLQPPLDLANLSAQPSEAGEVLLQNPFGVGADMLQGCQAFQPLAGPRIAVEVFDPMVAEDCSDAELYVAPLVDLLLPKADQPPQLAQLSRRQPNLGQVADPCEIRQQA